MDTIKKNPIVSALIFAVLLYVFMNRETIFGNTEKGVSEEKDGSVGGNKKTPTQFAQDAVLSSPTSIIANMNLKAVWPQYAYSTTLKKGMKGFEVKVLQAILERKGFDPKGVDGSFGANTENALKSWLGPMTIGVSIENAIIY